MAGVMVRSMSCDGTVTFHPDGYTTPVLGLVHSPVGAIENSVDESVTLEPSARTNVPLENGEISPALLRS